jgi:hypothetical protein
MARRSIHLWLLVAILLAQLPLLTFPRPAQAATDAPNADPSQEIVFLDANGVIRVLDLQGDPLVQWYSPIGGWEYIALGDFNDDGDDEIVALGQIDRNAGTMRLAVYDPVVAIGGGNQKINGIPWATLFETTLVGITRYVVAGNFDPGIPGDEFAIGFRDSANRYFIQIWNASTLGNNGKPTGRDWRIWLQKDFADQWSFATVGQLNGVGAEEIALFDDSSDPTRFSVFIPDQDFARMDGKSASLENARWKKGAIGPITNPGTSAKLDIATIQSAERGTRDTLIVYSINNENELNTDDDWTWAFAPNPEWVFLADITGNGDKEVFFLRNWPNNQPGARLIMRDQWGTDRRSHPDIEFPLMDFGARNEFRRGHGADVNGDGIDEVIIFRDNRIRVYNPPRLDAFTDYTTIVQNGAPIPLTTDRDTLTAGNLDAVGSVEGPSFGVNRSSMTDAIPTGTRGLAQLLQVTNTSTADVVNFNVRQENAPWIILSSLEGDTATNNTIQVTFDATTLAPGTYTGALILDSAQNVLNKPYRIPLTLVVEPAVIQTESTGAAFIHYPCSEDRGLVTTSVEVRGTVGLNYRAAVIAVPNAANPTAAGTEGSIADAVTGGALDAEGNIVLNFASNATRTIAAPQVSAAATLTTSWDIDPAINWITEVSSDQPSVPSTITINGDLSVLPDNFDPQSALLVMVADTRAGSPPDNVFILNLSALCANSRLALPQIHSAAGIPE